MEFSSLTLRVLLLFFPGVLCAILVDALTVHRDRTPMQFLTHAFALGIGSYLTLYVAREPVAAAARWFRTREPLDLTFFDALLNDHARIAWGEIALAACAATALAGALSAAANHKVFFRVANRLKITKKTGAHAIWMVMLDSPSTQWVMVRDLEHDLAYVGWVEAFSESSVPAEILLRRVYVFQASTMSRLYESDRVYISKPSEHLVVESFNFKRGVAA